MAGQYVVLGDVAGSRDAADRAALGERLREACERVNDRYSESVRAPFTPLKGVDELGGLLGSVATLYGIARTLSDAVRPHRLRIAVVGDAVDVALGSGDVSAMDGPAFHRADDLLEAMDARGYRFEFEADGGPVDTLLTDVVNLLLRHRDDLTDRQREVIAAYDRHGTQRDAAAALGITQQAVSSALRAAGWPMVGTVETRVEERFGGYDE